jgi:prepilin-type N-terminal cleavage/methylation domain-containing protein
MLTRKVTPPRRGLTLLEVLVALAILGFGAAGWAALLSQGAHAVQIVRSRETEIQRAAQELSRVSLWSREQVAGHVGRNASNGLILVIGEAAPSLYDVAVADTVRGRVLLHTSFYRRDSSATASR